jgi:hypothetical protein
MGRATAERVFRKTRGLGLFLDATSSALFYLMGLVMKRRKQRAAARELFGYAMKADPLNYWAALLARREQRRLAPGTKRFLEGGKTKGARRGP